MPRHHPGRFEVETSLNRCALNCSRGALPPSRSDASTQRGDYIIRPRYYLKCVSDLANRQDRRMRGLDSAATDGLPQLLRKYQSVIHSHRIQYSWHCW